MEPVFFFFKNQSYHPDEPFRNYQSILAYMFQLYVCQWSYILIRFYLGSKCVYIIVSACPPLQTENWVSKHPPHWKEFSKKVSFQWSKSVGPKPVWLSEVQNLHLLVSCARRTFSDEKVSSRSNRSSMGGGKSLKAGGKTWKTTFWV